MINPPKDCQICPRLFEFRLQNQNLYPDFYNGAVPNFGDSKARLLILGLAPGLKGANWSGRPFTGDYAGDLLYECLLKSGFAKGIYKREQNDGLTLQDAMISNVVRCVPPQNKPTTNEAKNCQPYLEATIKALPNVQIVFTLGKFAHDAFLRAIGLPLSHFPFGHRACHKSLTCFDKTIHLIDSYHCSRYNVNTGKLTHGMFLDALSDCKKMLNS